MNCSRTAFVLCVGMVQHKEVMRNLRKVVKTQFGRSDYESKGTSDSVEGVAFVIRQLIWTKNKSPWMVTRGTMKLWQSPTALTNWHNHPDVFLTVASDRINELVGVVLSFQDDKISELKRRIVLVFYKHSLCSHHRLMTYLWHAALVTNVWRRFSRNIDIDCAVGHWTSCVVYLGSGASSC